MIASILLLIRIEHGAVNLCTIKIHWSFEPDQSSSGSKDQCGYKMIFSFLRYILSLALADLLVIVMCVPFTSIYYTVEYWPWGAAVCKLSETSKDISIGVSVFTLTALSAERYCAIVNPLRRLQVSKSVLVRFRTEFRRSIVLDNK